MTEYVLLTLLTVICLWVPLPPDHLSVVELVHAALQTYFESIRFLLVLPVP